MKSVYLKIQYEGFEDSELPSSTYSELSRERYEIRKVDVWDNGEIGFADKSIEYGDTFLGTQPMPSLEEINSIDEWGKISAFEIASNIFESLWEEKVKPLLGSE